MSKRSAKFVAALTVSVLAGANLATVTDLRAQAANADDCLTAPKGASSAGSHWYYRIDRATKRQCWYLREESEKANDKSTRVTPPASPPASSAAAAEPVEPPTRSITRKAINDARAEYTSQQSRAEQQAALANPGLQTVGAAPSAPAVQDSKRAFGTNVLAPAPVATNRWVDNPAANAAGNAADVQTTASITEPTGADQQQDAEPVQQQPALQQQTTPAGAFGTADSSAAKPTASLQMLLAVMAAALALAGVIVSLVFRLGRIRARRAMRRQRLARWDTAKSKRAAPPKRSAPPIRTAPQTRSPQPARPAPQVRPAQPAFQREEARMRRPETAYAPTAYAPTAYAPRQQDARERQVTDMLARLARSAQH